MRALAFFCAAALLVPVVTGCTKSSSEGGATSELRIALPINPTQLNPILMQNAIESSVDGMIFSKLVALDSEHKEIPDLAEVVPTLENGGISKDGKTITYHLRHGVKWHDGAPFTSKDVKFSWQAVMNNANNTLTKRGYDQVASVDTPDDYTVVFHMKAVFPPFVDTVFSESDTPYEILPEHLLAKYPNLNQIPFNSEPIGTGPYKFARWLRGDRIVLKANPDYFKGAPKIDTLTLMIIPDDNTTDAQLRTHEVQLALEITLSSYKALAGVENVQRQLADAPSYQSLMFNTQRPPLDDVIVRRALVMAMDRDAIIRNHTAGTATLATADLSPFYWAFDPSLKPIPYDTKQAMANLDADGWHAGSDGIRVKNGQRLSLQLVFGQGSSLARAIAEELQQMYRGIGVDVQLKGYDYQLLYADIRSGGILNGGKFDLAIYAWISGADPDNESSFGCDAIPPNGNNASRYCSKEMDELQHEALSTFDRAKRKAIYAKIEALLLRDVPMGFMFYQPMRYAHVPELKSFAPNGISEGWNAQDWAL